MSEICLKILQLGDLNEIGLDGEFPGGPVVRTQHFHCRGLGSIPGRGTNIPQAVQCNQKIIIINKTFFKKKEDWTCVKNCWDSPGGAVVKNPPANAGDTDSSPGSGRSHMPRRN